MHYNIEQAEQQLREMIAQGEAEALANATACPDHIALIRLQARLRLAYVAVDVCAMQALNEGASPEALTVALASMLGTQLGNNGDDPVFMERCKRAAVAVANARAGHAQPHLTGGMVSITPEMGGHA